MATAPVIGITFPAEGRSNPAKEAFYVDAVRRAGGEPLVLRPGAEKDVVSILRRVRGVLLSGGDDVAPEYYGEEPHPALGPVDGERDRMEILLTRAALAEGTPVLGICKGAQTLNVATGGSLVQDIPSQVPGAGTHGGGAPHAVSVEPGSRLRAILGVDSLDVNSFHHQSVKRPGRGLRVVARTADGVAEAVERPGDAFVLGVQWHPERPGPDARGGLPLVEALVRAAAEWIPSRAAALP